jgi:putative spermidine/putrescine transport system ATP-binding protein
MTIGHLELRQLSKRYGAIEALRAVDLDVSPGEFLTLLGPSGSGKTTTLMIIAGFLGASGGSVWLDGREMTDMPPHKRNIGLVFQNYALFPHRTVQENIAYPLRMRRENRTAIETKVAAALALVQLSHVGGRYPRQLSGGQQQRIAVARATVYRPPLLLMDEPLSALDKSLRHDLQNEIRRIHRGLGTSIVYITHDQEEALGLSDRIAVMNQGQIVQVGTPEDIYERPNSVFAASFVGQSNFLAGTFEGTAEHGFISVRLTNGAVISGLPAVPLARGARVSVMVRPEHIGPGKPDPGYDGLSVTLRDAVYQGRGSRCHGTFETGEACTLDLRAALPRPLLDGTPRAVSWPPDKAVILPAEG